MNKIKVFITCNTHWDREWVMTRGQFQVRLVNLIDNLLDIMDRDGKYAFLLDGHAALIEDYLEIKGENRERLTRYLREGRLTAGPWYVLSDQFIPNGESAVRNLMYGMRTLRDMGCPPMMLGYVPDSFGTISSLPMILNGFGIECAMFGRGNPGIGAGEFIWETPDGSSVVASNHNYATGLFMSYPDIWRDIFNEPPPDFDELFRIFMIQAQAQEKSAATGNLFFAAGVDHMEPRAHMSALAGYINERQDRYELSLSSPYEYMKSAASQLDRQKARRYTGELRGEDPCNSDLAGTLSSRMYMKRKNFRAEALLQRYLEPLLCMDIFLSGKTFERNYPFGFMDKLYKQLIACHAHDSICGCGIDPVCRDIVRRLEETADTAEYMLKDLMRGLAARINNRAEGAKAALLVANPLGREYSGLISAKVCIPKRVDPEKLILSDAGGKPIPSAVRNVKYKNKDLESVYMTNQMLSGVLSKDSPPEREDDQVFTVFDIDFIAGHISQTGYNTLYFREGDPAGAVSDLKKAGSGMENTYLRVKLGGGTIDITDKTTGLSFAGLNRYADMPETGDLYNHECPAGQPVTEAEVVSEWKLKENNGVLVSYESKLRLDLPGGNVDIVQTAALCAGERFLRLEVRVVNGALDHMLRAAFDTDIRTDHSYAYCHFNIIKRPVVQPGRNPAWNETPMENMAGLYDGKKGFAVFTRGTPAYDALRTDGGTCLYVTLLRAAGSLGQPAGANHPAPEGQCLGEHAYSYALMPYGGRSEGEILEAALDYCFPPMAEADVIHEGALPPEMSLVNIGNGEGTVRSALKPSEDRAGAVLRLWNSSGEKSVKLLPCAEIGKTQAVKLDESVLADLPRSGETAAKAYGFTNIKFIK